VASEVGQWTATLGSNVGGRQCLGNAWQRLGLGCGRRGWAATLGNGWRNWAVDGDVGLAGDTRQ
jgi:hypothetical protein